MTTNQQPLTPWYKVPVMWLVIGILTVTVISALGVLGLAHQTKEPLVLEEGFVPLNKKQALRDHADHTQPESPKPKDSPP